MSSPHAVTTHGPSRRALLGGAGLGLLALTLGACSSRETVATTGEAAGDNSGAFTVTDMRGKEIHFSGPVQRIATTIMPSPPMIAAIDGGYSKIVGINEATIQSSKKGLFGEIFPQATTTTTIAPASFAPNIETVTSLKPDVVFQWADQGDGLVEPLENAGFTTFCLLYGTQEYLEKWVTMVSAILGKQERGAEIIQWMHTDEARIKGELASVTTPVRVVHLSRSGEGYSATNGKSYMHHWMTLAGGKNMAENNLSTNNVVSAEQLIEWDPEIITLDSIDGLLPEHLYADSALSSLTAVKNRRVYKAPLGAYRWDVPGAESPLMWQWTTELFHPSLTSHTLRASTTERIKYLYNYEMSQKQLDGVFRLDVNSDSADYDIFNA